MDFATFNGLYTLFLICLFIALIRWAYSQKRKQHFEDIAHSIFEDEPTYTKPHRPTSESTGAKK